MQGYLIDLIAATISPVDIQEHDGSHLADMYAAIHCDLVEVLSGRLPGPHDIWIDEEGAIRGDADERGFFALRTGQVLCGRALVLAHSNGDCAPCTIDAETIARHVVAFQHIGGGKYLSRHFEAAQ